MKKFLSNILRFSIPFWALLGLLLALPQAPKYSYNMVQKDCRTGMWIYRRLFESKEKIDIAFIGTSKTMCDVNDALLEEQLVKLGINKRIANLGVCRNGENLHYLIARDLFAQKSPEIVVVEISTGMATNSHFHFANVANTSDAFDAPLYVNNAYLGDWVDLAWNRLIYQRNSLFGIEWKFEEILNDPLHSYMLVEKDMIADSADMERVKAKRQVVLRSEKKTGISGWFEDQERRYPKYYFEKIVELAKENNAKVVFLYLPVYGAAIDAPQELSFYRQFGEVWIPPDSVFGEFKLHMDNSHLNNAGATRLNPWLVKQIAAEFGEKP